VSDPKFDNILVIESNANSRVSTVTSQGDTTPTKKHGKRTRTSEQ
jgi:hypothetical protein